MTEPQTLRRLVLVRAGGTDEHARGALLGTLDAPLTDAARHAIRALRRHWEWIDAVVSSPLRRARQSAALLSEGPIALWPSLRPRDLGRWQGLTPDEIEALDPIPWADWIAGSPVAIPRGERSDVFEARVQGAVDALLGGPYVSPLVVSHESVLREITRRLIGEPLPEARPRPAEMVLLTRVEGGKFHLGRRTSDPPPLRSPLEREGLSGVPPTFDERHVAHLERRA